jgi:hypothetical protein
MWRRATTGRTSAGDTRKTERLARDEADEAVRPGRSISHIARPDHRNEHAIDALDLHGRLFRRLQEPTRPQQELRHPMSESHPDADLVKVTRTTTTYEPAAAGPAVAPAKRSDRSLLWGGGVVLVAVIALIISSAERGHLR